MRETMSEDVVSGPRWSRRAWLCAGPGAVRFMMLSDKVAPWRHFGQLVHCHPIQGLIRPARCRAEHKPAGQPGWLLPAGSGSGWLACLLSP